jgi:hypothetical protein
VVLHAQDPPFAFAAPSRGGLPKCVHQGRNALLCLSVTPSLSRRRRITWSAYHRQ